MNLIIVQIDISIKTHEILKECAKLNNMHKRVLSSTIVNSWDGSVRLFQDAHKNKLNHLIEEYDNVRFNGIILDVPINNKTNLNLIKILNNNKYNYVKKSMVRDILISFLIHQNNKLINILKDAGIKCGNCMDILLKVPEIDTTEKYVPLYKRKNFEEPGLFVPDDFEFKSDGNGIEIEESEGEIFFMH